MAYSDVADFLTGDLQVNSSNDTRQKYVDDAVDEINSKLGWVYALPLAPVGTVTPDANSWKLLPEHEQLLLKTINNRLASGRWLLAQALPGEDNALHAYAASLIRDAMADLMYLANGEVDLTAIPYPQAGSESVRGPGVTNYDSESLLLGFENTVLRSEPWFTRPGPAD